jgi:hypothetical protein
MISAICSNWLHPVAFQACFLITIVICYVVVLRLLFGEIDHTMKRSRAALLLLPEDVLVTVPAIQSAVAALANSH